jgi:hypothetical protein
VSLPHLPGKQTKQAYWRGDMIERRLALMEDWSAFASPPGERRAGQETRRAHEALRPPISF